MKKTIKALSKQFFGAKYESARKSLLAAVILFIAVYAAEFRVIYLFSWQIINGNTDFIYVITLLLFAMQSAILSVILEWKRPIRNWKTESDLWHHPRKYIVPLIMLILATLVGAWLSILWIWSAALLIECGILLYTTRRE